ncbi:hypothetical protein [Motiliproteus sediminis]|uniref:hypothetical protein n=1 Tax=Motiliproteus sediminis TaxID=1468178 RepID=UPI001AEF5C22|nr:hypothetical protein [Motiliproteus sediminis]
MKWLVGALLVALVLFQAPLAWNAWQDAGQCERSLAKEASGKLAEILPELDVVDCSFGRYYKAELRDIFGG